MGALQGKVVVVAGGTGNVGTHIVRSLLDHGATVIVPSRTARKLDELREHLGSRVTPSASSRLVPLVGDVGDEADAERLAARIESATGAPDAVVASLGNFVAAPSTLTATSDDLRRAFDGYTGAHFTVARTFLPGLAARGGRYVFVNGPLAFQPWEGSAAGLVSIATAAQHMLFRVIAQELASTSAEVMELVSYAFIRERETQRGSAVPAEAVGDSVAFLLADDTMGRHGESIHLRSADILHARAGSGA